MRLLEMVTFSSVVKQSLSAWLGGVIVSVGPSRSFLPGRLPSTCARTSERAESLRDDLLSSAYWRPVWRHTLLPSTTGVAAPQSQPSLDCCPSVCTKAQSDCRPLEYRRPHSAMSLSITPPHILSLWQKSHRLDQALIFTGLQWYTGLVAPCASLALHAGGCILAFDRPSMFLFFLCVRTRTRAMMVSLWWTKKYWQTVTSQ